MPTAALKIRAGPLTHPLRAGPPPRTRGEGRNAIVFTLGIGPSVGDWAASKVASYAADPHPGSANAGSPTLRLRSPPSSLRIRSGTVSKVEP